MISCCHLQSLCQVYFAPVCIGCVLATLFVGCDDRVEQSEQTKPAIHGELHDRENAKERMSQATSPNRPAGGGAESPLLDNFDEEIQSLDAAQARFDELGESPTAEVLADCLMEVDAWIVAGEVDKFVELKTRQAARLRQLVEKQVEQLQQQALDAPNGSQATHLYLRAGQTLALFPLDEASEVTQKAQELSEKQAELRVRLQVIRRQRYNQWAIEEIEKAIEGYHKNASTLSPLDENALLVRSCVHHLRQIDPALLEPVVLELYSYVLDKTNTAIGEKDKIELARGLADPDVRRKSLGDF